MSFNVRKSGPIAFALWSIVFCVSYLDLGLTRGYSSDYPARQINLVVPFPPGGSADYFARVVFSKFREKTNTVVVIENRPGASGVLGAKQVIAAEPDGYTLLVTSVASANIPPNFSTPPAFDAMKDLKPITGLGTVPAVLVVRPGLGIKTFTELIHYAKKNPEKLNMASSGTGTIAHLAGELLMREAGVKFTHVSYRGAPPAVTDLLGGHADIMFSDAPFFLPYIKDGKLLPLAVGTPERAASLPDVPTTAELGMPQVVASNTYSLFASAKTPASVVDKLSQIVLEILSDAEIKKAFATQEAIAVGQTPDKFSIFVQEERDRWVPLAKSVGVFSKQ